MTCTARIQPRTPVLGHADYTALTRQQELDHTDEEYIFPERSRSCTVVGIDYLSEGVEWFTYTAVDFTP